MFETAVFEILYLFVYYRDKNFFYLSKLSFITLLILALISLVINFKVIKKIKFPHIDWGFFVFVAITFFMVVMRNLQGVNDGDDAYVLGNALTTLTNGEFYKMDYYTGLLNSSDSYLRHLLGGNPMFIAFVAHVSKIHPTVLAHRVLGSYYIILHNAIIYNIGVILFEKEEKALYRSLFASLVAFITIWDFHSYLCDSTFMLSRTWQGKAMFSCLLIPLTIFMMFMIGYEEKVNIMNYIMLTILTIASVFMTPQSIAMYSIFIIVISLSVSVYKKKIVSFALSAVSLWPMVIFLLLYLKYCRV